MRVLVGGPSELDAVLYHVRCVTLAMVSDITYKTCNHVWSSRQDPFLPQYVQYSLEVRDRIARNGWAYESVATAAFHEQDPSRGLFRADPGADLISLEVLGELFVDIPAASGTVQIAARLWTLFRRDEEHRPWRKPRNSELSQYATTLETFTYPGSEEKLKLFI